MPLTRDTTGVYAIAPTPFHPDGRVDHDSWRDLFAFYADAGVDGVTILGHLGEAAKLTAAEAGDLVREATASSTLPVVVGLPVSGFAAMAEAADSAMAAGAAGVMIAPDRALRSDDAIVGFFAAAGRAVGAATPWVLQDYPLVHGVTMTPRVIAEIAGGNDNLVMLKHEDWPGLDKISGLRELEEAGAMPHLSILCGNGGLFLDQELRRGADGAMTGYSFPEMLVQAVRAHRSGDRRTMLDLFDAHLPFLRYEHQQGIGLAVRKHVLARRGAIAHETLRPPAPALGDAARAEIDELLTRMSMRLEIGSGELLTELSTIE